jgi:hypothetical protein
VTDADRRAIELAWPGAEVRDGYFRYDTDDSTSKENWSVYCDIQDALEAVGWTIADPYIEHDCISGPLAPKGTP